MKLWLVGRRSAGRRAGGDAMQVQESARLALSAGLDLEVCDAPGRVRPARGDVVHLFNVQRCHDWGDLPERAQAAGARLLVTPLFHPLGLYHRRGRRGVGRLAARLIDDPDRLAGLRWARTGVRARASDVLGMADLILLSHEDEAFVLEDELEIELPPERLAVVPVLIDPEPPAPVDPPRDDFVLCAGRVEPLKNPTMVREAAKALGYPVRFVGSGPGLRHAGYALRLRRSGDYLGPQPYPELRALMARARVHVLGSWTEVVGRVTLEAALGGAAVVLPDVGFCPDYLRDCEGAFVYAPGRREELTEAMRAAWERGRRADSELVDRVRTRFTWNAAGSRLVEAWTR
jgi:glycosyltransferase involved in cell wall biosynthesis